MKVRRESYESEVDIRSVALQVSLLIEIKALFCILRHTLLVPTKLKIINQERNTHPQPMVTN